VRRNGWRVGLLACVALLPAAEPAARGTWLSDGTEFRASPAVVNGRLFLRSQAHLYCIGEKQ
jgi:hypothetical protein